MSLVKILDSTGNPILDINGDPVYVWDDDSDICLPQDETDTGICLPPSNPIDRQ